MLLGLIYDIKFLEGLKVKVYQTVIRIVVLYVCGCRIYQRKPSEENETKNVQIDFRSQLERKEEKIETLHLAGIKYGIVDMLMENRLISYGHIIRKGEEDLTKKILEIQVKSKLPKGRTRKS